MEMHVYHHLILDDPFGRLIVAHLADINDRLAALSRNLVRSEKSIMISIRDLQDQAAATLQQVQADTDVANAVKKVVDDQNETIDALKKQVDDFVAAGGASQADLQQLSDTLLSIKNLDTSNAQIVASAVTAGTQPAPSPGTGTSTGEQSGTDQSSTGPQAG
ncbi:hypothetical protein LRP30_13470 [Bradyrhizobium sp. C-145]|uniref:hypothetical protein n=1 Tax=Bradyrhizobium sp. C-145 TaxID=574727 RepID=UPI00201B90B5|nr:hypothetical protein [Bradyrhizobium sp. C-145]UQR66195.1 hypothetical protein LRP30_13470 [Bradyrhizobium sp. C-145]